MSQMSGAALGVVGAEAPSNSKSYCTAEVRALIRTYFIVTRAECRVLRGVMRIAGEQAILRSQSQSSSIHS